MNGDELKRVEQVFEAKLAPIAQGVNELKSDVKKQSEQITQLETKFSYVGNCPQHTAKVEAVENEIDKVGKRIWGLAIALIVGAVGAIAKFVMGK